MQKEIFLKKLDLLNISLEILTNNWNENNEVNEKFSILYTNLQNKNYNTRQSFSFSIEYIYNITRFIKKYSLHNLANKIIHNRHKYLKQYISKFCYLYYRNKKYYMNNKIISYKSIREKKIDIKDDAIITLYLISKIQKNKDIYHLTKYLNEK